MVSPLKALVIDRWITLVTKPSSLAFMRRVTLGSDEGKATPFDSAQVKRILVHRMDAMGDTVLTLPLLQGLRDHWPEAHITYAAQPLATRLLEHDPRVNQLLPVKTGGTPIHRVLEWRRACRAAGSEGFDLAVLPRWDRDDYGCAVQSYLLGSRWRVGHCPLGATHQGSFGMKSRHLLTMAVENAVGHEVERSFRLLEALGAPLADKVSPLGVPRAIKDELDQWLAERGARSGDSLIALGVGAGETKRVWPKEHFAAVARQLISDTTKVIVMGGPEDQETGGYLAQYGCLDATHLPSLIHSAALLRRANLFIGNDSGPMHLAASQGAPVVEISSHPVNGDPAHPHSPERFSPWQVPCVVLRPPAGGSIADVTVEAVVAAAKLRASHVR